MVGHYWLRSPPLAPTAEIRSEIDEKIQRMKAFAQDVDTGRIAAEDGERFNYLLHIRIGGSGRNSGQLRLVRQTIQWTFFLD